MENQYRKLTWFTNGVITTSKSKGKKQFKFSIREIIHITNNILTNILETK